MDAYEARLASFAPKKSSRSKKQQAASGGWLHPPTFRATPSRLAQAGFYFEPSTSKPDNVLCFMCGHALGNWEEQDDPFKVHVEHSPKCAWAIARCSIEDDKRGNKFVFTSTARLPTSRALEKARAGTFKGAWPHDSIKGHSANSRKMAKAGWAFTPDSQHDSDTATCFYCGKSLAGWEPEDNPTEEHKNRMPNCPFFTAKVTPEDDQEEETVAIVIRTQPPQSKASASHSRSGRTYTRTAPQSKRIAATASASEADPGDDGEDDIVVPAVSKKKLPWTASLQSVTLTPADTPRGVLKSVSSKRLKTEDEDMEMAVDHTEEPPQQTVSKSSSKTKKGKPKSTQTTEPSRLDVQELVPTLTRSSKKDNAKQKAVEEAEMIDLEDDEVIEVPPPPKKVAAKISKSSSKSRKGKTKSASVVQRGELETAPETLIEPVDIEMEEPKLDPPVLRAPRPVAQPPPPKPSQSVPVVVPKLALKPTSRPSRPSRDEDVDLKAAEDELDNMAMELDPTGEVRSLLKSKTSSSQPPSSRSNFKPQKVSSASGSQHQGQESVLQIPSLAWQKMGPKTMPRAGSVRAMMMEDEIEEEEVAQSLKELEEEGAVDTIPYSRNAGRPPFIVPLPQTNGRNKTQVEHTTSSSSSAKGKTRAIDPIHTDPVPPEPRTPSPAAVTKAFPHLEEVDHLPSPLLPDETRFHHLTEEDKDMTLEAYIRLEIERRKEGLRADGRRWIEEFLAYAERAKETIKAM